LRNLVRGRQSEWIAFIGNRYPVPSLPTPLNGRSLAGTTTVIGTDSLGAYVHMCMVNEALIPIKLVIELSCILATRLKNFVRRELRSGGCGKESSLNDDVMSVASFICYVSYHVIKKR